MSHYIKGEEFRGFLVALR